MPKKEIFSNQCPDCDRTFREPNELREHRKYVCARPEEADKGKEQANKELIHSEHARDVEYYQPIRDAGWKQQTGQNTSVNNTYSSGYMAKPGRPRQPKRTQENKKGTLRYEVETETWNCTKCEKSCTKIDARRATMHVAAHTMEKRNSRNNARNNYFDAMPSRIEMS